MENIVKTTFVLWVWKSLNDWAAQNNYLKKNIASKKLYIAVKHLDPCFLPTFVKTRYLEEHLEKVWRIQVQMYPKAYVELKYGACYMKNKVSAHRLGLVVKLSWRVAPPWHFKRIILRKESAR